MNFPKIIALVPNGEPFDEKAVNEGVWMSEAHLTGIENALSKAEQDGVDSAAQLATANDLIRQKDASLINLTEEIAAQKLVSDTLTSEKAAAEQKIADQSAAHILALQAKDEKITSLEAEVVALGKTPSGPGSTVNATEDEKVEEAATGKPGLLDPNHPVNIYAASKIANAGKKHALKV